MSGTPEILFSSDGFVIACQWQRVWGQHNQDRLAGKTPKALSRGGPAETV